jgi:DNA-binding NarL/FixJ family response regulator
MLSRIRVLLADDHKAILDRVAKLLEPEFEVVGKVSDGRALLEASARLEPDVLVLDISMPVLSGLDAARELQRTGSRAKIIFLTVHEEPEYVRGSFETGASGYVVKPRLASDLAQAIREAMVGRSFISPPLTLNDSEE